MVISVQKITAGVVVPDDVEVGGAIVVTVLGIISVRVVVVRVLVGVRVFIDGDLVVLLALAAVGETKVLKSAVDAVLVPIVVVVSVVMAVVVPVIFVMAGSRVVVAAFRVVNGSFIVVAVVTGFISFILVTEEVMVTVAAVL